MTSKPMTPREDVEFWLTQSMRFIREDGNVPVNVQDKLINLLRTILAERDEAYRRGQEDMRTRTIDACTVLGATHEIKIRDIPSGGYVATYEETAMTLSKLTIKETPDV